MHAAGEDMRICLLRTGRPPAHLDVQIAAGLVGYSYPLSHTNLVSQVLKVSLPTRDRTDWRRRPLTRPRSAMPSTTWPTSSRSPSPLSDLEEVAHVVDRIPKLPRGQGPAPPVGSRLAAGE